VLQRRLVPVPGPSTSALSGERDDDNDGVAARRTGTRYFVLGSRYVLCPIPLSLPLSLSLSLSLSVSQQHLPHPERPGSRTDERTASSTTRAPVPTRRARSPDTTYYSNARPGSGEARREPADIAVIHLAAGFRDSLTFLRIGSFASARRRPARLLPLRRDRPVIHSRRIRSGGRHVNRGCAPRASLLPLPVKSSAGFFNRRSSRTCPRLRCEFSPKAPRAQRAFADRRPISAQFTAMRAIQAAIAPYLGIPIATRRGCSTFSNRRTRERERERE